MATEVLTGTYKGHILTGTPEGEKGFIIKTWLNPDGNAVATKVSKGIVGNSFKTVSAAGVAVYGRMNEVFGYPSSVEGRHLKFASANGSKGPRLPKTAKTPVADKARKSKTEDKSTPVTRNSRKAGPVTSRRATAAEKKSLTPAKTKRTKVAVKAAPKSKARSAGNADLGDELDI